MQTWTIDRATVNDDADAIRVIVTAPDGETRATMLSAGELAALSHKITYDGKPPKPVTEVPA